MPVESQVSHRNVRAANLPYVSMLSPTETSPCYVTGSQDILTSIAGYAERRPGFATSDAIGFNNLQRVFTWDRNDGSFYKMYCDLNASNQAVVYKQALAVDLAPVSIFTDTGSSTPFDFVVSNNTLYFSNGHVAKKWDPVNGVSNWGIAIGSVSAAFGPNQAGAGADGGGPFAVWTNPNNVTSTVSYATATYPQFSHSNNLNATVFGFTIPAGNSIVGVQVTCEGFASTTNGSPGLSAQLLKAGNVASNAKSVNLTTSNATYTFGSSSDLWGPTWTANDINQTNFGVAIAAGGAPAGGATVSVRNVKITVYSLGGPAVSKIGTGGFTGYVGYQYVFCYGNSNTGHVSSPTPASASSSGFGGIISTSALAAGGKGYVANDTGIISAGNFNATYTVNTVTGGAVTTYTITAAGTGYAVANNAPTAVGGGQPGSGTGFTINISGVTGIGSLQVSLTASTDPQVNQIRVFRSTDSVPLGQAAASYFELPTSPYANTTANVNDSAADNALQPASIAPLPGFNDPPTPFRGIVYFAGRLWGFSGNRVYFSALEENTIGVPEESFVSGVAGNFWNFDLPTQGLAVAGSANAQTLLIYCGGRLYGIVGSSLDTFRKFTISNRRGCRNVAAIASLGSMVAWFDSAGQVWGTDGSSLEELGLAIRPDLASVNQANVSMTFHAAGRFHWLVVSTGAKLFVYDLDREEWMPPWSFAANYVFSGETSAGNYQLFGATATNSLTLSTTAHNDNGATYQPIGRTNLMSVVPDFGTRFSAVAMGLYDEPTRTGLPWMFQVDTNNVNLSDVLFVADDDPTDASTPYTSIFANATTPLIAYNRGQGAKLLQRPYPMTQPTARWVGWQWKGLNADDALRVYGYFMGYSQKR